jgi:hypothetical protein
MTRVVAWSQEVRHDGFFLCDRNVVFLDWGDDYTNMHICQNSLNYDLKIGAFILCKSSSIRLI